MENNLQAQDKVDNEIDFLNEIADELILKVNEMFPLSKTEYKQLYKRLKIVLENLEFMP